jgi:predicted metal-binding membrane protein
MSAATSPGAPSRAPAVGRDRAALRRDRAALLTAAALIATAVVAWIDLLTTPMQPDMAGMGMAPAPTLAEGVAFVIAWAIMMAAMMLPSALPMIGLYAATQRKAAGPAGQGAHVALFTAVYLGLWAASGIPIYFGSVVLGALTGGALPHAIAAVLVVAGLFQLSPLKQVCLRHCRSPLGFLLGHWRPGWRGSLSMGWRHAVYCLGCCWALMVVLVAAGAMGLAWVLLIATVVAAEKLLPRGEWIARLTGVALVGLGAALAVRPDLAMALRACGHPM